MNGMGITAHWVPLMQNSSPIPDPVCEDAKLCPQTEIDTPINPKYGFDEKFEWKPFEGEMDKLSYRRGRQKKRWKDIFPTRMMRPHNNPGQLPKAEPIVEGGMNQKFLAKHNLDKHIHPMDWSVSLMPITQKGNKEFIRNIYFKLDQVHHRESGNGQCMGTWAYLCREVQAVDVQRHLKTARDLHS